MIRTLLFLHVLATSLVAAPAQNFFVSKSGEVPVWMSPERHSGEIPLYVAPANELLLKQDSKGDYPPVPQHAGPNGDHRPVKGARPGVGVLLLEEERLGLGQPTKELHRRLAAQQQFTLHDLRDVAPLGQAPQAFKVSGLGEALNGEGAREALQFR